VAGGSSTGSPEGLLQGKSAKVAHSPLRDDVSRCTTNGLLEMLVLWLDRHRPESPLNLCALFFLRLSIFYHKIH
jgi:hypothetical protein